ncbi:MAG: hypothetical protein ABSF83_12625, partial [Nitrososphaerales archaeon]
MTDFIPLGSATVAAVFAILLARQYAGHRRTYQLIWVVSMALFSMGAFLEFVMSFTTVSGPLFDLYYASVGPETGLLGAGVVYLLRPRIGKYVLYVVVALSACLIVSVIAYPVNINLSATAQPSGPTETYQQWFQTSVVDGIYYAVNGFGAIPRAFTQVLNYLGSILVIGGGLLSFIVDRKRTYALVIVLGASMDAIGGILLAVFNYPDLFLYFEFAGIVLLFLGFLMSARFMSWAAHSRQGAPPPPPSSSPSPVA